MSKEESNLEFIEKRRASLERFVHLYIFNILRNRV